MQPGYPGSGQDPYGQQQPPYSDPYAQPQYPQAQPPYQDPYAQPQSPYQDPYAQPQAQPPYQDPYAQPQPTSGNPYPGSPAYPSSPAYQGAPQYPVAGYGAPAGPPQNNTLGLLGMIFGIVSIPLAICCGLLGLALGVAGVILGVLGMRKAAEGAAGNRGQALAGTICGGVGILFAIINMIAGVALNWSNFT